MVRGGRETETCGTARRPDKRKGSRTVETCIQAKPKTSGQELLRSGSGLGNSIFYFFIMNLKETLKKLKQRLGNKPQFEGKCRICHKTESKRGMVFHHVWYVMGEKISGNFSKLLPGRIAYHEYIEPIMDKRPNGFRYYCNSCHQTLSRIRNIRDNDRIRRLFEDVLETVYYTRKEMKEFLEAGKKQ